MAEPRLDPAPAPAGAQPASAHGRSAVPAAPTLEGLEAKWDAAWSASGIYRFDPRRARAEVFSIDTPPPTVSGSLHVGHMFSYTHTDIIARYRRMAGQAVFYPMGWDDNGLPTERRVQNYYGVRCNPALGYDADFAAPADAGRTAAVKRRAVSVSRPNFIELCEELTAADEQAFEGLFRRIGLSVDWSRTYATVDARCRRVSQIAFLENLARGEAYQREAPSLWDVTFQTAVAQAELEDRDIPGTSHRLRFRGSGGDIWIETTRPELTPSCVALVAHPDDSRYRPLLGSTARTPVFDVEVPVLAHRLADPDKGTGIAMVCTFGDTADITWWRDLDLPVRTIIGRDGRLAASPPAAVESAAGRAAYAQLAGRAAVGARAEIAAMFAQHGDTDSDPRDITHAVKFFEKGAKPLEIVSSRQWYIRNGGRDDDLRRALIERGAEMNWVPPHMQTRYESWIRGLTGDWLVSRQRFFGVPIPLWYRLDGDGSPDYEDPIRPAPASLAVDPSAQCPAGYGESQRGQPGGFAADPDVMDTWATSSLTPQIATGWRSDATLHAATFPMDMRPQGHDIIRTWLFSSVVRAHFDADTTPWRNCALSGWVLDPDRKKMAKAKGNAQTPTPLLDRYGADAVRHWAARSRPGTDTAVDEEQFRIGRRLAVKLLNASKFVLQFGDPDPGEITETLDRCLLGSLAALVDDATAALEGFDYARALQRIETFFWTFTDDHIELVKARAHGAHGAAGSASALRALRGALGVLQQMFAPFMPFAAEEVWSWWHTTSVHVSPWPQSAPLRSAAADVGDLPAEVAAAVLAEVRRAKSQARLSPRNEIAQVVVTADASHLEALASVASDVGDAGRIQQLVTIRGDGFSVQVQTAAAPHDIAR